MELKTIKCAILDDELTARQIMRLHIENIPELELVADCKNALELIEAISNKEIDLLFLDIKMPDVLGTTLAKSLDKNIKIIFATAYREFAIEGFDLQVVDYLLKPISFERFKQAIDKFIKENKRTDFARDNETQFLELIVQRELKRIRLDEIYLIESRDDFVLIHTNSAEISTRENISTIAEKLKGKGFVRIHRSFIVSKFHIQSFTREKVFVKGEEVPVSRTFRDAALAELG